MLTDYFRAMPDEWRKSIKAVSIGMSKTFEAVVLKNLPTAAIVVDSFHIAVRLYKRVDEARRYIQNKQKKEGKERVFNIRWLILKNVEDLTVQELIRLNDLNSRHFTAMFQAKVKRLKASLMHLLECF